jgi:hypothetical protein
MDPGYMGNTMNTYLAGRLNASDAIITYTPGWEFRIGINEIGMIPLSEIELMRAYFFCFNTKSRVCNRMINIESGFFMKR